MWLLRGLDFTAQAMRNSVNNKNEELATSFTNAYGTTLRPHHGMLIRPVFALAMKACPYRKDFYAKLGEPQEKVDEELEKWLASLEKIVAHMKSFYAYVRKNRAGVMGKIGLLLQSRERWLTRLLYHSPFPFRAGLLRPLLRISHGDASWLANNVLFFVSMTNSSGKYDKGF